MALLHVSYFHCVRANACVLLLLLASGFFCGALLAAASGEDATSEVTGGQTAVDETGGEQVEPEPALEAVELPERDLSVPGYGLPLTAPDPFHPPLPTEPELPGQDTPEEKEPVLTEDAVRSAVTLGAVVDVGGKVSAIINRQPVQVGDTLTLNVAGKPYELTIRELKIKPSQVVFATEDRTFVVSGGTPGE